MRADPWRFGPARLLAGLAALLLLCMPVPGLAQGTYTLTEDSLKHQVDGALAILGFSVVPNETASTLTLDASGGDTEFRASQLGGAFTVSDGFPLYLEGFAGIARYNPTFVFSNGSDERAIEPKWTSVAGTVGIGWDIPITDTWVVRPIANGSLGHIESDVSLVGRTISRNAGVDLRFLEDGRLTAFGYGGSLMLDYERYRAAYEADIEIRYTHIRLESLSDNSDAVDGSSDAITLGLWSRLRVPTGLSAFGGPVRGVGEFAASHFMGNQADFMETPYLAQVGAGIEFDTTTVHWLPIYRTRLMVRYLFGENLHGVSTGLGITF